MTNYETLKEILCRYAKEYSQTDCIESTLHDVSVNKSAGTWLYNEKRDLSVIDMDEIAHHVYRIARYPTSGKESDSAASNDAFLISSKDEWYFIEFKDQKIRDAKEKVTQKAYANWYFLMDILYEMREKAEYPSFDYCNPIKFAREKIIYILVVSEEKNADSVRKIHDCRNANMKYRTDYIEKIRRYLFHDAYIYTPALLEQELVKKFEY